MRYKPKQPSTTRRWWLTASMVLLALNAVSVESRGDNLMDLTRQEGREARAKKGYDCSLGPIGARGFIEDFWARSVARQILIDSVAPDSPADGVLRVHDVILGVSGKRFASDFGDRVDIRRILGRAITEAEKFENKGRLTLIIHRDGRERTVTLKLKTLGTYAVTAPFKCPKTEKIVDAGCEYLASHPTLLKEIDRIMLDNCLAGLALLASGDEKYHPLLGDYAKKIVDIPKGVGGSGWNAGYMMMFVAEYFLATKDKSVLPGLRKMAEQTAAGQSHDGYWGHGFQDGGKLAGYGPINQPSVTCNLGLILARKCGIRSREIDTAIEKFADNMARSTGIGCLPYGAGLGGPGLHDNNGTSGSCAIMFDLLRREKDATWFSWQATAAHGTREYGHTGWWFNVVWSPLGSTRAGEHAIAARIHESTWYLDLERQWNGSFRYYDGRRANYGNLDLTGGRLLTFLAPHKRIYLTGKEPSCATAMSSDEAAFAVTFERNFPKKNEPNAKNPYGNRSVEELYRLLDSWSVTAQMHASTALAHDDVDHTPKAFAMLKSPRPLIGCALISALGDRGKLKLEGKMPAQMVDRLLMLLANDDVTTRLKASEALATIGEPALRAAPAMMQRFLDSDDVYEETLLSEHLFNRKGILFKHPEFCDTIDNTLFIKCMQKMLRHDMANVRSCIMGFYKHIPDDCVDYLWTDVLDAMQNDAPTGTRFRNPDTKWGCFWLCAEHGIREGFEIAAERIAGKNEGDFDYYLKKLREMGANAAPLIPTLEKMKKFRPKSANKVDDLIAFIRTAPPLKPLRSGKQLQKTLTD